MKNNNEKFIEKLENLAIPEIKISNHGQILKSRLLSSSHFTSSNSSVFSMLQKYFLRLKNIIDSSLMIQKRSFAFGGAFTAFALVVMVGFSTFTSGNVAHAEAKELVTRSYAAVSQVAPEMRAYIEKVIARSMEEALNEAKNASDLKVISKEEWPNMRPAEIALETFTEHSGTGKAGTSSGELSEAHGMTSPIAIDITKNGDDVDIQIPEIVKLMSYTNKSGEKVLIGLDANDMLVFRSIPASSAERAVRAVK